MRTSLPTRIGCLFNGVLLAFFALLLWQGYWHLAKSTWLLRQPLNRRLARQEAQVPRGEIVDREGTRLAWSDGRVRHYASGRATAGVLGYVDPVYGRTGLEGAWDDTLSGITRGDDVARIRALLHQVKPHSNDLVLTLDLRLQQAALDALGDNTGAAVLLDPATGGILAAATAPTFDAATVRNDYPMLLNDTRGPLRNRALQDIYPPGSTMKLVTAAAALMHGVDPATTYTCTGTTRLYGVTVTDFHGEKHGTIAMLTALAESCNNYFARTAAALSSADFTETAAAFGFNHRWWTRLPDPRVLPVTPAFSALTPHPGGFIAKGELAHMGFGQSTVVATPLQMAMVAAATANDGTAMAPYLVAAVRKGGTTTTLQETTPQSIGYPLDRDSAKLLADMMRGVVTHGTGRGADARGITVYGKTGTAQQQGGNDHAWFVGFAERTRNGKSERIAFAVLVERGGTGGRVAVPIARKILEAWKGLE